MKKLLYLILTFLCFSSVSLAQDIYVDASAGGANNGSSWTNAYIGLQDAIDATTANQEIWVAAGTYFPSASPDDISTDPRDKSFHIGTDIKIYGGFDGTETALSQRDWTNNATILSGDIGTEGNNTDNSYHVFITANLTSAAVIDGFTVQDGNANGSSTISYASQSFHTYSGGGMYNYSSSPTFTNVTLLSNEAFNGGGMYNSYYSSPTLEHVIFSSNEATSTGGVGGDGGGVYNFNYSNPTFRNVMFTSNEAAYSGGGVCNSYYSSPTFQNVTFTSNKATTNGGGVYNNNFSSPAFQNVTFSSNEATSNGGGVYNSYYSSPTLQNVTFSSNEATSNGGGMYNFSSSPKLINTLFFKNTASSGADVYLSSSSIASESSNNASDASNISGTRTVDLSGLYYKDIIVDSTDLDGPDDVWMTADDGLIITGNSILKGAGTATGAPSEDITGYTRPSPPSIGAYEYNPCLFAASVVYVDLAATGNGTGTSWANAYTDLQDALDARMACTGVDTILVAEGTYYPTSSPVGITTDARDRAFYLVDSNVVILGGYSASAGTPIGAATILSGDLVTAGTATDSAYHVFITAGLTLATVLDNVTITASEANGSSYIVYGSYHFFQYSGGGMYNYSSSPKLTNVTFTANTATYGGGMYNVYSSLKLTNVTFSANTADEGGGIYNNTSSPSMVNLTFTANTATYGGGIFNVASSAKLTNVTFASNIASSVGGGMYNNFSSPTVTNCIFWNNKKVTSTTVAGADIENLYSSTPVVTYTSLQNYAGGTGCITGDPLFVDAANSDLRLMACSPAIDKGTTDTTGLNIGLVDLAGNDRVLNNRIDMGAYEGASSGLAISTDSLTWIGAVSTAWNEACNWSPAGIPTATNDVIIPSAPANQPTLSVNTAVAKSVEVRSGASFTIAVGGELTINNSKAIAGRIIAFYNDGTVNNNGKLTMGNLAGIGKVGLYNLSTFNNNTGGEISIDSTSDWGIFNRSGDFTNDAKIGIGANSSVGSNALANFATFNNNAGGEINLDYSSDAGLYQYLVGIFTNVGKINIGANHSTGPHGIKNEGIFNNNAGGEISVDNVINYGIYNLRGTFTNVDKITIGANSSGGDYGIHNLTTFNNNTGAEINIDKSTMRGLSNEDGIFTNAAKITIGANGPVGQYGLYSSATFNNNTGGDIKIDNASDDGLTINDDVFTNEAKITLGSVASPGFNGIFNRATFSNNAGGDIKIDNSSGIGFFNVSGTFSNQAKLSIGANASIGEYGIRNNAAFNNNLGGEINIDNSTEAGLFHYGLEPFHNYSKITIGSSASVGKYGLLNESTFNNNAGGEINIDSTTNTGLVNRLALSGIFTNAAKINIGTNASVGLNGISNIAIFNNNSGGEINIDNSGARAFSSTSGTVNNSAKLTIGANAPAGYIGLYTEGIFNNNTDGEITIDSTSSIGLWHVTNTFTNQAKITIGSIASVGNSGLQNTATFNNNAGGEINIDNTNTAGLTNELGVFTNSAKIIIGTNTSIGDNGILNKATFNNNTGGNISIDRSSNIGLLNQAGSFTNAAKITIGSNASVGAFGIFNDAIFNSITGGDINIDNSTTFGIINQNGEFTNAATITIGEIGNGGLWNKSIFNNNACGKILLKRGKLLNSSGHTYTNTGFTHVIEELENEGTFTNNGILKYGVQTGNPVVNSTDSSIIVNDTLSNFFSYGGTYNGTVNGIFSDETGSVSAGDFTAPNGFTPRCHLPLGLQTLYASITSSSCSTPQIVPLLYNNAAATATDLLTWTGAVSTDWNEACNWAPKGTPTATNDVVIPGGLSNQPTIFTDNTKAGSILVQSGATFTIAASGKLELYGSKANFNIESHTFINYGTVENHGTLAIGIENFIDDYGLVNHSHFNNNVGGEVIIDRSTEAAILNIGTINNDANITIGSNAETGNYGLYNFSSFNNTSCAIIKIEHGKLKNDNGTLLNNIGYVYVSDTINNAGTFTNNGVLKYGVLTNNAIINATDSSIIINDTLSTIFNYGGTYNGTVNGIFTNEAATVSAGTYLIDGDVDFKPACNLPGGTQTLYASITSSSCSTPVTVPFLYNNVVATATDSLTWTGEVDTVWNNACNWAPAGIPTATNDVIIPAGPANQPTLSVNTAVAKSVEVRSGASFTIATEGELTINNSKTIASKTIAFYNDGTVNNNGKLTMGNLASIGEIGLYNLSAFNNNTGGEISIDSTSDYALYNETGIFTNAAEITIGASSNVGNFGLYNTSNFNNNTGGDIVIDRTNSNGILNSSATLNNSAKITIGANTNVGIYGIRNFNASLNNNTGGEISIDRSSLSGLVSISSGSINNYAKITIGANALVGQNGIQNSNVFDNNTGGEIHIDNSTETGLRNSGAFANSGKITIGANAPVGENGLSSINSLINTTCAELKIFKGNLINYQTSAATGTITNAGYILVVDTLKNDDTFTNDGILKYSVQTGNTIINSTNSSIIVNNTPSTLFTYGGTYNGTVNGVYTDEAATVLAGTFMPPNAFVPNNTLPLGSQTLYAKVTPDGGACSYVVPFLFDNFREIDVRGNYVSIANGDMSPSVSDLTDFGVAGINFGTISNIFMIINEGTSTLTLGPNPITKSGPHAADFTILQPSETTIAPGDSVYFDITFDPSVFGERNATISIANDDADESPYTFAILGNSFCNAPPTASITGSDNLSCAITSVTRTASVGNSYSWSNGDITEQATISAAGTYTVTVTAANGCSSTATTEVTIDNTPPTASITGSENLSCDITSVSRTASGGTSYSWSNELGTNAIANINTAGTYTVTVTAANGCSATATTAVTIDNTPPTVNITGTDSLNCTQNTVNRTASGGLSYAWSNGLGNSAAVTISNTGTYTVTVTTANGCTSTATTEVVFDNNLVVTASNDGPYEEQETINLMATGGPSYSWVGPDGFTSNIVNPSIANASPANSGIYTVTVTNGLCTGTATTNVVVNCSTPGMSYFLAYSDGAVPEVFSPLVSEMEVQASNRRMTVLAIPNCELPLIESARLQLSGTGNTQFYVDNEAPYSLYENNGAIYGDVFETNYYTFIARGYAQDNSQGLVVGPDVIRFWVVSGDREISSPILSTNAICAGANLSISASTSGVSNFNVGNMYQAYLSDVNGNFENQILIGSSSNPASISCTIPNNIAGGNNYKIKIRSSSPVVSSESSLSLAITSSNLNLLSPTNDILSQTQTEQAIQSINAENKIDGNSDVMYTAGNAILLAPGFSATAGNVFSANIEDVCVD
ncbi:3-coathanger stack domain-containing protein [uncultured Arcticibacterium sp.]|uniref:3-coathanger stack domain-containing protein n=1 Tax=uncultured Arcticibacterium sp. TaxID=2173042 RepID=UPI0030FB9DDA